MRFKFLHFNKHNKQVLDELIQRIKILRSVSNYIVFCPSTTGYNWMGVNRATFGLFEGTVIELPHYYSSIVLSEAEQSKLIKTIKDCKFEQIIFSGFPAYFEKWISELKTSATSIGILYHGFFSEFESNADLTNLFGKMIRLAEVGLVDKIGFNKEGMAEAIKDFKSIKTFKIILKTPLLESKPKFNDGIIHIGVLGNENFRKNIFNQVTAALLIPNSVVHVTTNASFSYLDESRIIREGTDHSHTDFLKILGSMDINLHLSYSESWGQLTSESLAMGVPCLIANHSDIFEYDEFLKTYFVVNDYDNVYSIAKQIKIVLDKSINPKDLRSYVVKLNELSNSSMHQFLDFKS